MSQLNIKVIDGYVLGSGNYNSDWVRVNTFSNMCFHYILTGQPDGYISFSASCEDNSEISTAFHVPPTNIRIQNPVSLNSLVAPIEIIAGEDSDFVSANMVNFVGLAVKWIRVNWLSTSATAGSLTVFLQLKDGIA